MIQHREASYRLDKPTHVRAEADIPPRENPQGEGPAAADEAAPSPPEGWVSLADCTLAGASGQAILVPLVLLHPEFGVALLGVPGAVAPVAEAALRQRLDVARFAAIFPGYLPVVALAVLPGEALNLQRRLAAAFATVPPLELAGGDGWVNVVRRALLSRSPIRLPSLSLPPSDTEAYVPAAPHRRHRPRHWLWPLAGLTGVGVLVGLAVGLSHTPGDPGSGAEMPPRPVASAPPAVALPQPPPPVATAPAAPPRRQAALPPPAVEPSQAAPALPRVLVRSGANLRAGPDSRAEVLRVAPRGEAFWVHGEARGGWVQVGDAEPRGWIHSSLLSEAAP